MVLNFILIAVSLVILAIGAEGLVRGSSSLALRIGLTPLMVGLTVVAFGTSSPELVVSLKSVMDGQGDIALGNVVGSNIFNIGIILGITALVCPIPVKVQVIRIDAPIMLAVAMVMPVLLFSGGGISRLEGVALVIGLVAYIWLTARLARREAVENWQDEFLEGTPSRTRHWGIDIAFILAGLALLIFGSRVLVDNCIQMAQAFGISEAVIGLTIVAAGTSMPELATSLVAAMRKEPDIAIGNIVGSNIFNILSILGITSIAVPIAAGGIRMADLAVMIVLSAFLLPVIRSGSRLCRIEGLVLLVCYAGYLVYLWPK